jgi:hypothetical protein
MVWAAAIGLGVFGSGTNSRVFRRRESTRSITVAMRLLDCNWLQIARQFRSARTTARMRRHRRNRFRSQDWPDADPMPVQSTAIAPAQSGIVCPHARPKDCQEGLAIAAFVESCRRRGHAGSSEADPRGHEALSFDHLVGDSKE